MIYNDYNIETYMRSRSGTNSLLNLSNIKEDLKPEDYINVIIRDGYNYRIDKISKNIIGMEEYYFLILLINNIYSFDDIQSGTVIKIPTTNFINKLRDKMRYERGI